MSKWVSKFCLCQSVFCCFVCSVLFLNWPSLNDCVLHQIDLHRTEWDAETQQLQRQVQSNESKRNMTTPVRIKIEDRHRIMYCDVPKIASTNLKRLMLILSGAVETDDLSSIPRRFVPKFNSMPKVYAYNLNDTILNREGNFTKFMFARHPLERLVSAYQDRLAGNNTRYHQMVGKVIIQKHRKNPSPLSLEMGDDVTFPEFVSFIIDEWKDGKRPFDPHWRPVVALCLPCEMRFDFIGKFETLNQDVDFLLRKTGESDLSRLLTGQPKSKTTLTLWKEFMKTISHQTID